MEREEQYRAELINKKGGKEILNWRDYVDKYKNLNTIHDHPNIPEMYKGYPGIMPGTIENTMFLEGDTIVAQKYSRYKDRSVIKYIVNINDLYDDDEKEQRLENSKKLYEIFKGVKIK